MRWYDVQDGLTTSPVEKVRNEYAAAIRDVEDALAGLREDLLQLETMKTTGLGTYFGAEVGDASTGAVVKDFESALTRWGTRVEGLIGPFGVFTQAVTDVDKLRLPVMRDRLRKLDRMCVEEDVRGQEFLSSEIPF
jgi:hypothetical protein